MALTLIVVAGCDYEAPLRQAPILNDGALRGHAPDELPVFPELPGLYEACPSGYSDGKLDVLIVMDDSASMTNTQFKMKQQAARMISRLTQLKFDYHLALTTTSLDGHGPAGSLLSVDGVRVIKPGNPLASANQFASLLDQVTVSGSSAEFGILTAAIALSPSTQAFTRIDEYNRSRTLLGARDEEFFRDDAKLFVVIISDEDDRSTMSAHPQALLATKSRPEDISVVAVVDPSSGPSRGCNETSAWTGAPRYHEGIAALGGRGTIVDFCASLDVFVDTVALLALKQDCADYPLADEAAP